MSPSNLHVYVMTQSIMATIEAMKALNYERDSQGLAQAYGDEAFQELSWDLEQLAQSIDHTGE